MNRTAPAPAENSLQSTLRDNEFLVELLSELTSAESGKVREKLAREHLQLGSAVAEDLKAWGLAPYVYSDKLSEFYEQTDAFLYETLVWNRTAMKQAMRDWIAAFLASDKPGPRRVLLFGDGLGIDSLFLAEAGHEVDYYEVSRRCIWFANRLGERLGRKLSVISSPDELASESYDVVVCLDVLEHVPNPPELVGLLASFLRPGGNLLVHAPFWYIHPNVSTHLKSNLRYSGESARLYRAHGLRPIAGELFWNPLALEKATHGAPRTQVNLGTRLKIASGGLLLKFARLFRWPHLLAFHWMFRQDRRRLRDLAASLHADSSV